MSKVIDERVVEMRFDNKQFASATKETLGLLEKLKASLHLENAAKGFESIDTAAKSLNLEGISSGVAALEKRFSTLGIVGMRVIENMTDSLMNMSTKAMSYVSDAIISGGLKRAQNIENAHFQLQALLKDEEKVQAVMSNAMASVDGTAYAYDEAAKAAAQFAASGMESGEKMESALRGITGVAAMTNSQYESISMIFTTVAGNGRLMGDQLLQLSSRGLNAAATVADYFREVKGQANMTESAIRELVSKGQIDFETFAAAMDWAFGESAFRANETFTGALSNMKSALARIGAEFFSPLIEQNSDLILVINALRERINDVKKSVTFDEQTSAISGLSKEVVLMNETISQFVKDGSIGFDRFTNSILGTSKTEEQLAEINKRLSYSYDKIKESGSASVETLVDFNKNGINASKAIQDYINGVLDGTVRVSDAVKSSIYQITGGARVVSSDITKFAQEGKISYDIFTDAIVNSSELIQKESELASDVVTGMMNKVKDQGSLTSDSLAEFTKSGINATQALKEYMDGVNNGTVRASYATKQAVEEITKGTEVAASDIAKFAQEGKISYAIFQSAMENMYGDQKALSKQFTDFFLDSAKAFAFWLKNLDLSKPMDVLYFNVESIKNVVSGLLSVLKPIGKAFSDVFLKNISMDNVVNLAAKLEELTSKMKMSEKGSKNLHDAFEGIFSVLNLVIKGFTGLFGIVVPVSKPIGSLTDLVLALAGAMGRGLTGITNWINKSKLLNGAYNLIASGVQKAMSATSGFISSIDDFVNYIYKLPFVQKIINNVVYSFETLYNKGNEFLPILTKKIENFGKSLGEMVSKKTQNTINWFINKIEDLDINFDNINLTNVNKMFVKFTEILKELLDVLRGNEGLDVFITNMEKYFKNLTDAFNFDRLLGNIEKFKNGVGGFVQWFRNTIGPIFEDFSLGGAAATAGGFSIIYAVIKAVKAFDKVGSSIQSIPNSLNSVKGVLEAYQKDLKADAIVKIASAIGILAVSLTVLSFADTDKIYSSVIALGLVGAALVYAVGYLTDAAKKGATIETVLNNLAKGLKRSLNNLAKAVKWKAIGSAMKDAGVAIGVIVASILALTYAYSKDSDSLNKAVKLIAEISAVMVGLTIVLSALGNKIGSGMKSFNKAGTAILALSASIIIVISAMKSLFKLEIPEDYGKRLIILGGIFAGLAALAVSVGAAGKISGGKSIKSGPILALAGSLYISVIAIKSILKMDIPDDYDKKFKILAGLFGGFIVAILAIGVASRISKDGLKATGTILSMCAFIVTAVGALAVLSIFPGDKLINGAVALGTTILALAVALVGAGKIAGKETWKTVIAMALEIGSITAALGILSMIPKGKLLVGATALGAVLMALAVDLLAISKITNKLAYLTILSMTANVAVIAYSLYVLADQPWSSLLAGAGSLSAVLLAVAGSFKIINASKPDVASITSFLMGTVGVLMVAVSLSVLASQPWEGILSAGASLSAVLVSIAASYKIMSTANPNLGAIAGFIGGLIAIVVIGSVLGNLASQPWDGLLAAAGSISLVLIALSASMAICTVAGAAAPAAIAGIALLDLFIADLTLVLYALGHLSQEAEDFLNRGGQILTTLGTYLGEFFGNIVGGVITGITSSLPQVGQDLSDFTNNAGDFFTVMKGLDDSVLTGAKNLAETILVLTVADVINGISSFLFGSSSFSEFGTQLKELGKAVSEFGAEVKGIDPTSVEAASNCAKILAELYKNMPKEGGWMQKIMGEQKTLAEFAEELIPFGRALVQYSSTVAGKISQSAVEASIKAAEVLVAFNDTLPNMGGLVQIIFGNQKTLAEFAEEIIPFGRSMVAYSAIVAGKISQDAVQASVNAASSLVALQDGLGKSGGIVSLFTGDQDLSDFGSQITKFGEGLASYSNSVSGIDTAHLDAVIIEVSKLVDLANGMNLLDTSGMIGFVSALQTMGNNGIDAFVSTFSESYGKVNNAVLLLVTNVSNSLVANAETIRANARTLGEAVPEGIRSGITATSSTIAPSIILITTTIISTMNSQLTSDVFMPIGQNVIVYLINGINAKKALAITTVKNLCVALVSQFKVSLSSSIFNPIGQGVIQALINGMNSKKALLLATAKSICDALISQFKNSLSSDIFFGIGGSIVQSLANGINSQSGSATSAASSICNSVIQAFRNGLSYSTFYSIGSNAGQGLADGIRDKIGEISDAAISAAAAAVNNAKQALQVHSPSRVFFSIGQYVSQGLANGIVSKVSQIRYATQDVSEETIDLFQKVIRKMSESMEDGNVQPMIKPVMDLSNVKQGFSDIESMFNKRFNLLPSYQRAIDTINNFEYSRGNRRSNNSGNKNKGNEGKEITITYEQNITSPKALSQSEIYRRTKGMFSKMEEVIESI